MPLDVRSIRSRFPAFERREGGHPVVYADGPAGTQVPRSVIEAVAAGMAEAASNVGGSFSASARSQAVVEAARSAAADLLGGDPGEIVFGPNMTTLTFAFSRAVARRWDRGDRIVLSSLDHDANITPWVRAAAERDVEVVFADLVATDATLDLDHLETLLTDRTRLVAVTGCSNAFGSLVDVGRVAAAAHRVGARCFVDAVHLAPHRRIDVVDLGVDALVCSAYKFFGPHVGALWGRADWLDDLDAYRVRPAPSTPPGKFETGTPSFSLLAGFTAAVDYLADLGDGASRRERLDVAFEAIGTHEAALARRFLAGLPSSVTLWGRPGSEGRVSTFAVGVDGRSAAEVATVLGEQGIAVWAGHYYAVEPMARLDLLDRGGLVRIGFVHPNTSEEVDRVLGALERL